MAYHIFLTGSEFNRKAWRLGLKARYLKSAPRPMFPLSGLGCQLADLYPNWRRDEVWLHPLDGIGGVMLRQDDDGVQLEILDCCAASDVGLAWELTRLAIEHGAVASDLDHTLTGSNDELARLTYSVQAVCWSKLVTEVRQAGELVISIGNMLDLRVTAAEASRGSIELERNLIERMRRYSHALIAGVMTSVDDSVRPFAIYAQIATLIPSSVEAIYVHVEGVRYFSKPIPARRFYQVLGTGIENLGDWNYVPAIDLGADPDSVYALQLNPAGAAKQEAASRQRLCAADWARLAKAPCLVFMMVVSAEGTVNERELTRFEKLLNEPHDAPSSMVAKIIGIARENIEGLVAEILSSETTPPMEMLEVRALLGSGKIPASESKAFARYVYSFAESVASASGGIFGMGRISKREGEVLATLRLLLRLEERETYTNSAAMGSTRARP